MQDRSLYEDLSSPAVATTAVFMIAVIYAKENRKAMTLDIGGAYLTASMGEHEVQRTSDGLNSFATGSTPTSSVRTEV